MTGFAVTTLGALPSIRPEEGVDWRPVEPYRRLTAFGVDVYRAAGARRAARRPRQERFESTWRPDHFTGVPTLRGSPRAQATKRRFTS